MDQKSRNKWNSIYGQAEIATQTVTRVIEENAHLLPQKGRALDIACGTGSDAVFLARHGLETDAWDISDIVVEKINLFAKQQQLSLVADARDVTRKPPKTESYNVVVLAHFLERELVPALIAALKPGGLIFYQTFLKEVTVDYSGPSNPNFRLASNELLKLFAGLQLLVYREEALIGDVSKGFRNEAMLVARKPV